MAQQSQGGTVRGTSLLVRHQTHPSDLGETWVIVCAGVLGLDLKDQVDLEAYYKLDLGNTTCRELIKETTLSPGVSFRGIPETLDEKG